MKSWYLSKTLWVNVVSIIALLMQNLVGKEVITPEEQIAVLSVINIILRLITKTPLSW